MQNFDKYITGRKHLNAFHRDLNHSGQTYFRPHKYGLHYGPKKCKSSIQEIQVINQKIISIHRIIKFKSSDKNLQVSELKNSSH